MAGNQKGRTPIQIDMEEFKALCEQWVEGYISRGEIINYFHICETTFRKYAHRYGFRKSGRSNQSKKINAVETRSLELKPCPFCGGRAKIIHEALSSYVQCSSCNVYTDLIEAKPEYCADEKIAEFWNRRVKME